MMKQLHRLLILAALSPVIQLPAASSGPFSYIVLNEGIQITKYDCSSGAVVIPEEIGDIPVVSIGENAFLNCSTLTSLTFPDTVKTISNLAFYQCTNLTEINFKDGLETIGESAFSGCSSLTVLKIPRTVSTIKRDAFRNCTSLWEIYFFGATPSFGANVLFNNREDIVVYYPSGATGWDGIFNGIPNETFIPYGNFIGQEFIDRGTEIVSEIADTSPWLGLLDITNRPYVFNFGVEMWMYVGNTTVLEGAGWVYVPDFDLEESPLDIEMFGESDWGWSNALGIWLFVDESGWLFTIPEGYEPPETDRQPGN